MPRTWRWSKLKKRAQHRLRVSVVGSRLPVRDPSSSSYRTRSEDSNGFNLSSPAPHLRRHFPGVDPVYLARIDAFYLGDIPDDVADKLFTASEAVTSILIQEREEHNAVLILHEACTACSHS